MGKIPTTKRELVNAIKYHDMLYWVHNRPEISDEAYDQLVEQLKELDPHHKLVVSVNHDIISGDVIKHPKPMLSLNKVYTLEDLKKWATKIARSDDEIFNIQPKYDGVAGVLYDYDKTIATRGDGYQGEDITNKKGLIKFIGEHEQLVPVYGEIIVKLSDFDKFKVIRRDNGECYKTPRSAVSGILGLKDIDGIQKEFDRYNMCLSFVNYKEFTVQKTLTTLISDWEEIVKTFIQLDYPMDGLVVSLADPKYFWKQGYTAHHPKGAMSFKFSNGRAKSRLINIKWQVGKNKLTPVGIIKPTIISGVNNERVTLHNYKFVKDRDICIGDFVTIERAGDVIPHIVEVRKSKTRKPAIIESCPSCNTLLSVIGVDLCCTNLNCFDTNLEILLSAVKRLGIENLGKATIKQMMLLLSVHDIRKIFSLTKEDLSMLHGFQEKSVDNLMGEINKVREHTKDWQLLAAMEMYDIGTTLAKHLMKIVTLDELCKMSVEELTSLPQIGKERAVIINTGLLRNKHILAGMMKLINVVETDKTKNEKFICFSGKMNEPRSYYERIAIDKGYTPTDHVTKDLDLLVIAPGTVSSKVNKAKANHITIMTVSDWLNEQ